MAEKVIVENIVEDSGRIYIYILDLYSEDFWDLYSRIQLDLTRFNALKVNLM